MPYLIILVTLVMTSCKGPNKTNALSEAGFNASLDQRAYLTIEDRDAVDFFRGKLLNQFVEDKFPSKGQGYEIKNYDELVNYNIGQEQLIAYAEMEKKNAKIIVSYTDHTEVYFLPENVPLTMIPSKLSLKAGLDRRFKWINTNITKTYNGSKLYLVSLNIDDIIKNDQKFFEETFDYKSQFANQKMRLSSGKMLELNLNYNVYAQNEEAVSFKGTGVSCTKDLTEAGMCGACHFTRNVPASSYSKVENFPISELGIALKVGEKLISLSDVKTKFIPGGLKVNLDSTDFDEDRAVDLEIVTNALRSESKYTQGYNYTGFCKSTSNGGEISLGRKLESTASIKILGRGREFLKNVL